MSKIGGKYKKLLFK